LCRSASRCRDFVPEQGFVQLAAPLEQFSRAAPGEAVDPVVGHHGAEFAPCFVAPAVFEQEVGIVHPGVVAGYASLADQLLPDRQRSLRLSHLHVFLGDDEQGKGPPETYICPVIAEFLRQGIVHALESMRIGPPARRSLRDCG
jgi:hypothetical protein